MSWATNNILKPITTTDGTPTGTRGSQAISATNSIPTAVGDAHFAITSGRDQSPPRYLSVKGYLSGTAASGENVEVYLYLWDVDTEKWYPTDAVTISADDQVVAAGTGKGNVYLLDCDPGVTYGFLHVPTLAADVTVNVVVRRGM